MSKTKEPSWLNRLYLAKTSQACVMIADQNALKQLLLNKNILILFRYIQNLPSLDYSTILRTVLLTMQLSRFHSKRFRKVFSHVNFDSLSLNLNLCKQDETYFYEVVYKIAEYIKFSRTTEEIGAEQLEMLTKDLFSLKQGCKNKDLVLYGQFVLSIIQEICLQFWNILQGQMIRVEELQEMEFMLFYKKYSAFCSSRRKIPKCTNKNLQNIHISRETNQNIERILKEYKNKELELRQEELSLKPRIGVAKMLALMDDFDDDEE